MIGHAFPANAEFYIKYFNRDATQYATISFYAETRPDKDNPTFANGKGIATVDRRIKNIRIAVGASILRVYKLGYEQSGSTGFSRLANITEVGRPDAAGSDLVVTGGTALPPTSYTYSDLDSHEYATSVGVAPKQPNFSLQQWPLIKNMREFFGRTVRPVH